MRFHKLTNQQQTFLDLIAESKIASYFTFTGGTALSSVYLKHRFSEDLDFFSQEEHNIQDILTVIKKFKPQLKYKKIDLQTSLNRNLIFLHFDDQTILKTEFTYYPFPSIEKGKIYENLKIDSLKDIAANKLLTLTQKPRSRDYIDLYYIFNATEISIKDLFYLTKQKFDWHLDPLQLGSILASPNLADSQMIYDKDFSPEKFKQFFTDLARQLKDQVLKK